jgi:hypothetical protein
MKILKKKTRKAIEKSLRKVIKQHAPAIAAGLATGLASSLATLAGTEAPDGGGKSNLGKIVENVQAALTQQDQASSDKHHDEKKTRHRAGATRPMEAEPAA